MPEELGSQIGKMWQGFRKKAAETVARQESAMVRGKIAGSTVSDDAGNVIVEAGRPISDNIIARAEAAGKLHALVLSATTAQVQDFREKARDSFDNTEAGQERKNFDSIEEFAEARAYVGRVAGVDVTDIRGNVVVPAGKEIKDDDVRQAREAGLLSALVYAAQQPYVAPSPVGSNASEDLDSLDAAAGSKSAAKPSAPPEPVRRARLPLVTQDDNSAK